MRLTIITAIVLVASPRAIGQVGPDPHVFHHLPDPGPGTPISWGDGLGTGPDLSGDGVPECLVTRIDDQENITLHIFDPARLEYVATLSGFGKRLNASGGGLGSRPELGTGTIGDVDGDGVEDIFLGNSWVLPNTGEVWVLSGSDYSVIHNFTIYSISTSDTNYAGTFVEKLSDLNGDGVSEFAVNNTSASDFLSEIRSGADAQVLYTVPGYGVIPIDDVDDDGVPDLAYGMVGSPDRRGGIASGADGSVLHTLTWSAPAGCGGSSTGTSEVLAISDLDGDQRKDVVYYEPYNERLFAWSSKTGNLLWTIAPSGSTCFNLDCIGSGVAAGDLNGDGFVDVAIPGFERPEETVYSGLDGSFLLRRRWTDNYGQFIWQSLETLGDLNKDGIAETLIRDGQAKVMLQTYRPSASASLCTGVANSTGKEGRCVALGSSLISNSDLTLWARLLPAGEFGYFIAGKGSTIVNNPGGSAGNLCLGGDSIYRLTYSLQAVPSSGFASTDLDLLGPPLGGLVLSGETWNFQFWHRDGMTSNFTEAVSVLFQ